MKGDTGKILRLRGMDLRVVDPTEWPGWDDALLSFDNHSIFHTTHWARVLVEAYGYRPRYFVALGNGVPRALIPVMEVSSLLTGRRGVSLPFTDSCEPLAQDDATLRELNGFVVQYGREAGWKSIEWRGGEGLFPNEKVSSLYYQHTIALPAQAGELESGLRSSTRRNIRKAEREGIEVQVSRSYEAVEAFYRLNCMTRRHHGLPPQPIHFFRKIFEHIISRDRGVVVLGLHRKQVISACVYLHFGANAIYKYGASDRRFQNLRPNNLVMWEGLRWCQSRGFRRLSLGRSEPENSGLLQFKRGWSGQEGFLHYRRLDFHTRRFVEDRVHAAGTVSRILRAAPIPLLRLIGAVLYRHVG